VTRSPRTSTKGEQQGATSSADGRSTSYDEADGGFFLAHRSSTVVSPEMDSYRNEIFVPFSRWSAVESYADAVQSWVNENPYATDGDLHPRRRCGSAVHSR